MAITRTERISGIVILVSLAVIIIPWLISEPSPRAEKPSPTFVIDPPVAVEKAEIASPEPPEGLGDSPADMEASALSNNRGSPSTSSTTASDGARSSTNVLGGSDAVQPEVAGNQSGAASVSRSDQPTAGRAEDPIFDMLSGMAMSSLSSTGEPTSGLASSAAPAPAGDWAVQVGSFGNPDNAERLGSQLETLGVPVFTQPRGGDLTTVLVGPYSTSERAEEALEMIQENVDQQGLLVRVGD